MRPHRQTAQERRKHRKRARNEAPPAKCSHWRRYQTCGPTQYDEPRPPIDARQRPRPRPPRGQRPRRQSRDPTADPTLSAMPPTDVTPARTPATTRTPAPTPLNAKTDPQDESPQRPAVSTNRLLFRNFIPSDGTQDAKTSRCLDESPLGAAVRRNAPDATDDQLAHDAMFLVATVIAASDCMTPEEYGPNEHQQATCVIRTAGGIAEMVDVLSKARGGDYRHLETITNQCQTKAGRPTPTPGPTVPQHPPQLKKAAQELARHDHALWKTRRGHDVPQRTRHPRRGPHLGPRLHQPTQPPSRPAAGGEPTSRKKTAPPSPWRTTTTGSATRQTAPTASRPPNGTSRRP